MKKILSLLFMCALFYTTTAQTAFSHTASNPTGVVTNTSVDTMTYSMVKGYQQVAIQPVITKTGGTVAGTTILYYSVNGTNWVASGDTLTNTNITTNTTLWNKTSAARYWQIRTTGSGTMGATTDAKIIIGN